MSRCVTAFLGGMIMTKQERIVRVFDGVIFAVAVVLLAWWVSTDWRSERVGHAGRADEKVTNSADFTELPDATARPTLIRRGARVFLPDLESHDCNRNIRSIVLLASATCPACNDGITFYRSLGKYARDAPDLRFVIAAAGDIETVRNWADTHGIQYDLLIELRNAVSFGFSLTPTLLLMEKDCVVTDVLLRRLSAEEESMLWERLQRPDSVSPLSNARYTIEIDDAEFQDLIAKDGDRLVVVDVRRRSDYRGSRTGIAAINIPMNELAVRGPVELGGPEREAVVVDCTSIHWSECRWAGSILENRGIKKVLLLLP